MICNGRIASVYLGKIKKTDIIAILIVKYNIKKFIWRWFLFDNKIPSNDVAPINNTGKKCKGW